MQKKYDWHFLLNVKYVWNAAWGFPLSNRKLLYFMYRMGEFPYKCSLPKRTLRSASLNSESMLEFILVCSFFSSLHLQSLLQRDFTEVSLDLNQHHVVSEWLRSCFVFEPCFRVLDCNSKWQMTGISYFAKHPSFFHQQQQHHIYKLRLRYVVIKNVEMYLVSSNSAFPVWSKFKLQRR